MPRKSKKSRKFSKNKVDKSHKIKLCQNIGEKQFMQEHINQRNYHQFYHETLQQSKSFVIKKTLTNEKLGRIIYAEFDDHIYIWVINISQQKRRQGYATQVINYLKAKKKTIKLHCSLRDNVAINLWFKMGFNIDMRNNIDFDVAFVYQPN